jgi:hypothetical protein
MTKTLSRPISVPARMRRTARPVLATAVAAGLLALVTGCGDDVKHGTVVEKEHESAHTEYKRVKKNGKYRTKKVRHSECWELELRDKNGKTGDICVSRDDYNRVEIGDKW